MQFLLKIAWNGCSLCFCLVFFVVGKEFSVEKDEYEYADGDVGVSEVENRTEEDKVFASPKRDPSGEGAFHQGEVEHINHFAMQEGGVTAAVREDGGYFVVAVTEYHAIEEAVDDVADGSAEYQREREQYACRRFFAIEVHNVPTDSPDGKDAEQAKEHFACFAVAKFHSECHAVVFDKEDFEPVPEYGNFFTEHHVGFNPDFDHLVNDK